jgi:hypothetical protein
MKNLIREKSDKIASAGKLRWQMAESLNLKFEQ